MRINKYHALFFSFFIFLHFLLHNQYGLKKD